MWPYSKALESEIDDVKERHLVIAKNLSGAFERYYQDVTSLFTALSPQLSTKELQPEIKKDITGLKEEFEARRAQLLTKIFPVGNILEVYAQDYPLGKNSYALLMDWKYVESLNERDLLDHALSLHKRCDKLLRKAGKGDKDLDQMSPVTDIKRYGLTRLMLDELFTSTQQFQSKLKLRKDVDVYRKKTGKKLEGLIRTNRKLLKSRLDKLMTVFSGTHPSFYREYNNISTKN